MSRDPRRSLGSKGEEEDMPDKTSDDPKTKVTTIIRVLTVVAYIVGVSSAAVLLSAYYVFLWVPQPSEPLQRPTDSPFSLAQQGNTHFSGGSHYYSKNPMDVSKHLPPPRGSKKSHHYKTTVSPNFLPRPQYLVRNMNEGSSSKQTTPSPRSRY